LRKGIKVYGGFAGTEDNLDNRDWEANKTVLSGGGVNYHVVTGGTDAAPDDTRLDGFTVTGGNATGFTEAQQSGGGMYTNNSSPAVANCVFSGNTAQYYGGGMCIDYSSDMAVVNCVFSGNTAQFGGGMFNNNSDSAVESCGFSGNTAQ
jgi:parallel beta-helix repeat protein